jgi:3-keto-disaccharide hydrolase
MRALQHSIVIVAPAALLLGVVVLLDAASLDPSREALPPMGSRRTPVRGTLLFSDNFDDGGLAGWTADRSGVWKVRRGMLRAVLPDAKQERSLLYAGSDQWEDYAVELDVCAMRGVDKGVVVRVQGESGIGVDLRGPGYHDVLLHRREWPMGKARVNNGNAVWQHLRVEAHGHRYRVWVNGALALDRTDSRKARPRGRIALAAYTGGTGQCTVYYDNVAVVALDAPAAAARSER